jgi:hypothetical protein
VAVVVGDLQLHERRRPPGRHAAETGHRGKAADLCLAVAAGGAPGRRIGGRDHSRLVVGHLRIGEHRRDVVSAIVIGGANLHRRRPGYQGVYQPVFLDNFQQL